MHHIILYVSICFLNAGGLPKELGEVGDSGVKALVCQHLQNVTFKNTHIHKEKKMHFFLKLFLPCSLF